ncbi:MAG: glutathione S-transferase family protein [Candidatus Omnitrophica bacterium]|nr:glutathione S-transferase family protein [Candidatus Omnitrophota bacterium]
MIKVYYAPPSIYARKVLAVLEEKGLDYTIEPMSFQAGDHKKAEYLKLNPNGEIPTLVDDDRVIYESTAINEYLDEEYPYPSLMPKDSFERAKVRMIEEYCDLHFYRALINYLLKVVKKVVPSDGEEMKRLEESVKGFEQYINEEEDYLVGEFSLADCAAATALSTLEKFGLAPELLKTDKTKRYLARLKLHAAYKGANLFELENQTA